MPHDYAGPEEAGHVLGSSGVVYNPPSLIVVVGTLGKWKVGVEGHKQESRAR